MLPPFLRRSCAPSRPCASGCRSRSRRSPRRRAARSLRRRSRSRSTSLPDARLIAASTLSFGMLTARAFWSTRRRAGLECGSVPPVFTATAISLLMRVNAFAMRSQRANIVCLRTSKMRPIGRGLSHAIGGRPSPDRGLFRALARTSRPGARRRSRARSRDAARRARAPRRAAPACRRSARDRAGACDCRAARGPPWSSRS